MNRSGLGWVIVHILMALTLTNGCNMSDLHTILITHEAIVGALSTNISSGKSTETLLAILV